MIDQKAMLRENYRFGIRNEKFCRRTKVTDISF